MEGFYCEDGADICKHVTFWRCPHAEHVMVACKYCNLWCKCVEQTFIEHHLLGTNESILECLNVSKPMTNDILYILPRLIFIGLEITPPITSFRIYGSMSQ
jgi:hypothetical protein